MEIDGFWIDTSLMSLMSELSLDANLGDIPKTLNKLYPNYRQINSDNSFQDYLTAILKYSEAE